MKDEPMDISLWFNLTYAAYLVLPRLWLETMPIEWQQKFVALLNEIPDTLEIDDNYSAEYTVIIDTEPSNLKKPSGAIKI